MINDSSVSPAAAAAVAVAAAATASSRATNSELEAVSKILEAAARSRNFPPLYPVAAVKGDFPASLFSSGGGVEVKNESGPSAAASNKELMTIDSLNQSMVQCFQLKAQVRI